MGSEIVATALEQLAYAITQYPIQTKVFVKALIGNHGGTAPEITIQFSVQKYAKNIRTVEVEMSFWQAPVMDAACILILDGFNTNDGEVIIQEVVNLKHLDDAYPYFEKAIDLFGLEKME